MLTNYEQIWHNYFVLFQILDKVFDKNTKKQPSEPGCYKFLAESWGFEPQVHCCTRLFESRTFDHSDSSPGRTIFINFLHKCKKNVQEKTFFRNLNRSKSLKYKDFLRTKWPQPIIISSQPRYDHFGNSPFVTWIILYKQTRNTKGLNQYTITMINFMLNNLSCKSFKCPLMWFKFRILIRYFNLFKSNNRSRIT